MLTDHMTNMMIAENKSTQVVTTDVRGPTHPLEFKVLSAHRQGSTKPARVEPDSVNSVLLDRCPNDKWDQWLVAADVNMNASASSLLLRATNFMPNSPGMGALLAMIFAPRVEMRTDTHYKKYTGCLMGLGDRKKAWDKWPDVEERRPYFAEHDIELKFDVEIDEEDLALVNQARYAISKALTRDVHGRSELSTAAQREKFPANIVQRSVLIECQRNLQSIFQKLFFNKERHLCEKDPFFKEYHWRALDENRVESLDLAGEESHIFPAIAPVNLQGTKREIMHKLENLHGLAKNTYVSERLLAHQKLTCPICPKDVENTYFMTKQAIVDHIASPIHGEKLDSLMEQAKKAAQRKTKK